MPDKIITAIYIINFTDYVNDIIMQEIREALVYSRNGTNYDSEVFQGRLHTSIYNAAVKDPSSKGSLGGYGDLYANFYNTFAFENGEKKYKRRRTARLISDTYYAGDRYRGFRNGVLFGGVLYPRTSIGDNVDGWVVSATGLSPTDTELSSTNIKRGSMVVGSRLTDRQIVLTVRDKNLRKLHDLISNVFDESKDERVAIVFEEAMYDSVSRTYTPAMYSEIAAYLTKVEEDMWGAKRSMQLTFNCPDPMFEQLLYDLSPKWGVSNRANGYFGTSKNYFIIPTKEECIGAQIEHPNNWCRMFYPMTDDVYAIAFKDGQLAYAPSKVSDSQLSIPYEKYDYQYCYGGECILNPAVGVEVAWKTRKTNYSAARSEFLYLKRKVAVL